MILFNVQEIAQMMGVDDESVRRWIRCGRMKSIKLSNKDGHKISDNAVVRFLEDSPKYKQLFFEHLTESTDTPNGPSEIVANLIIKKQVFREDIANSKKLIAKKKETIKRLESEILKEMARIEIWESFTLHEKKKEEEI